MAPTPHRTPSDYETDSESSQSDLDSLTRRLALSPKDQVLELYSHRRDDTPRPTSISEPVEGKNHESSQSRDGNRVAKKNELGTLSPIREDGKETEGEEDVEMKVEFKTELKGSATTPKRKLRKCRSMKKGLKEGVNVVVEETLKVETEDDSPARKRRGTETIDISVSKRAKLTEDSPQK
ncbi:hypothetical protein WAI453_002345 [Rhynchosporium graminicola]|uniref:Uncharacterized protein n=1 Tax=Rhynchosporium graminicola TaxID=2792576 RepID=A0A1E1LE12_9HELO|nr:uncharacterized protein RCO7_09636 [Rhynchosporium commune]